MTVRVAPDERSQVLELATIFDAKVLAVAFEALTLSLEGPPDKLDDFEELLAAYGIVELQRTGRSPCPSSPIRKPTGRAAQALIKESAMRRLAFPATQAVPAGARRSHRGELAPGCRI